MRRVIEGGLGTTVRGAGASRLFDAVDPAFEVEGLPAHGVVGAAARRWRCATRSVPRRRGAAHFGAGRAARAQPSAAASSCAARRRRGTLRVYPDFAAVSRVCLARRRPPPRRDRHQELSAARQRHGLQAARRLPAGRRHPRHRLEGDAAPRPRHRPRVPGRRDQCVVFLLDCGRRMRADEGSGRRGSHFDAALDALMLLAYVALKEGDEVGAMTFGGAPGVEPPRRAAQGRAGAQRADRRALRRRARGDAPRLPGRGDGADEDLAQAIDGHRPDQLPRGRRRRARAGAGAAAHAPSGPRSPACASEPWASWPSSRSHERDAIEVAGAHLFAQAHAMR